MLEKKEVKEEHFSELNGNIKPTDIFQSDREKNAYATIVCDLIKKAVADYFVLPLSTYSSKSRMRTVIKAKQSTVYFIKKALPSANLKFIGNEMNYNHSTVIHCLKTINNLLETDIETKADIEAISRIIHLGQDYVSLKGVIKSEYYYIDINNCISTRLSNEKAIIFTGFTEAEASAILQNSTNIASETPALVQHYKTGLFILTKKEKNI